MIHVRLLVAILLAALGVFAMPRSAVVHAREAGLAARLDSCSVTGVSRVVAVGDVHGEYRRFAAILKHAGVIDAEAHWAGGTTHLVQTGDVVDRGPESRRALDLLMRLEREAPLAGGRVHALLGIMMVMLGDFRYTSAEEIQAFAPAAPRHLRPADAPAGALVEHQAPAGLAELRHAFGADGKYGKWLRTRNTIVNIDGVLFVHGGISPSIAGYGCAAINRQIHRELTEGLSGVTQQPLASLAARPDGPLWFRGLAQEDATSAHDVDAILKAMQAHTMLNGEGCPRLLVIETRAAGDPYLHWMEVAAAGAATHRVSRRAGVRTDGTCRTSADGAVPAATAATAACAPCNRSPSWPRRGMSACRPAWNWSRSDARAARSAGTR